MCLSICLTDNFKSNKKDDLCRLHSHEDSNPCLPAKNPYVKVYLCFPIEFQFISDANRWLHSA